MNSVRPQFAVVPNTQCGWADITIFSTHLLLYTKTLSGREVAKLTYIAESESTCYDIVLVQILILKIAQCLEIYV